MSAAPAPPRSHPTHNMGQRIRYEVISKTCPLDGDLISVFHFHFSEENRKSKPANCHSRSLTCVEMYNTCCRCDCTSSHGGNRLVRTKMTSESTPPTSRV